MPLRLLALKMVTPVVKIFLYGPKGKAELAFRFSFSYVKKQ